MDTGFGNRRRVAAGVVIAAAVAMLVPSGAMAVNVTHTFDSDAQGWRALADNNSCFNPSPHAATRLATGGNPGGYLSATDDEGGSFGGTDSCAWFFIAPVAFSGQLRANYGGTFSVDIKHPAGAEVGPSILLLDSAGNLLVYQGDAPPANTWTTYSFPLNTTNAFYSAKGADFAPATATQVFDMLANLAQIQIQGDLSTKTRGDTTGMDNVKLLEPPAPLDTDGDGVLNSVDLCPAVAGTVANQGCPDANPACTDAQAAVRAARKQLRKAKASAALVCN